ncbi:chorismate--pyruvate lyase family protein [Shewanella intestini]|uniref:Probable chorismate pyruvate-lyase n=1 Tax=Shewanella intestini TaxID=2017544 RepID=A0ABS5I5K8_9GAMM|nr:MULTISPECIES: chorismate lyase [Shewanella]MBR9729301.1 chorismate lyase [Shewanella intestini]MRG37380.1 chorismate lyase [Shewanella sp. XMDDZSB0408]
MNVTSISFPYGEAIQWFSPQNSHNLPNMPLRDWLLDENSLTTKLRNHCQKFDVTVLGEHLHAPLEGECEQSSTSMWIREVLLSLDGTPWVFARTLIPQAILDNPLYTFATLGTRPLGELLFNSNEIRPGNIEVAQFETCGKLASLALSLEQPVTDTLWGRRRYFELADEQIIVSEIFLPAAMQDIIKHA